MNHINPGIKPIDPSTVTQLILPDGTRMPQAAFGTFHSDNPDLIENMKDIVTEAVRLGYRHIDCATAYQNEEMVGMAIKEAMDTGLVKREELFVLSKLWNKHMTQEDVIPACEDSLRMLGLDYLDLYVVHWPWPNFHVPGAKGDALNKHAVPYIHEDFMKVWDKMTELKKSGKVKNIGTSNQTKKTMELLLRDASEQNRPVYNQMEMHPLFQQKDMVKLLIENQMVPSGYMSLGSPRRPGRDRFPEHQADMQHHVIQKIASENNMTAAQVCLSWAHQREKSRTGYVSMAERSEWIRSNLETATKNSLSKEQFEAIDGDGTETNPGINANNRLIWGQVFFWPEARLLGHDRDALWNDIQIFETRADYEKFKKAAGDFYKVWKETVVDLQLRY
jgi:diketogulonate reductase-like aldo/keto reductase